MSFLEKERLSAGPFTPKWVFLEHLERYKFASNFVKDKIVIDCACGSGIGARIFAEAGARQVEAFDVSPEVIDLNGQKHRIGNLHFYVGNAEALPIPNRLANVFISLETIEHLANGSHFLAEVKRVLKPGGIFICSTPNRTVTNPGKTIADKPFNKFHVMEYSKEEFAELLRKFFAEVKLYGQNLESGRKKGFLAFVGRFIPGHFAARVNQFFKLPRLLGLGKKDYSVKEIPQDAEPEYLVAVCL